MTKTLVLFDFDGTLTTKDSFGDFIIYCFGYSKTVIGGILLSPYIIGYLLKIISNESAKEHVTRYFFGGQRFKDIQRLGEHYAAERIPKILRPKGLRKLEWHKAQSHKVVIVTASASIWVKPWADKMGVDIISTNLTIENEFIEGFLEDGNCNGEEKVKRIILKYDLLTFDEIYAYGDTSGDRPMLKLASHAFFKPFR